MLPETRNPTARGGAAGNLDALGGALDDRHFSLSPPQNLAVALIASGFTSFSPKELAVSRIARRFGLSRQLAAVVALHSGLGGRA